MRFVQLASGTEVPALGLGTWRMGEARRSRAAEVRAVRIALEIGYRLIDTAEMYGNGGAEDVVGAAVREALQAGIIARADLTIVSKVLPGNASHGGVMRACERSLNRLQLDAVDLYLLHWRGSVPLEDTVAAFEQLRTEGRIRHWGVSNFDTSDMQQLWSLPTGVNCVANQIYYSASERGAEFDLVPWQREHGVVTMAYSPIDQGALANDTTFAKIGRRHRVSASGCRARVGAATTQPDRHPDVCERAAPARKLPGGRHRAHRGRSGPNRRTVPATEAQAETRDDVNDPKRRLGAADVCTRQHALRHRVRKLALAEKDTALAFAFNQARLLLVVTANEHLDLRIERARIDDHLAHADRIGCRDDEHAGARDVRLNQHRRLGGIAQHGRNPECTQALNQLTASAPPRHKGCDADSIASQMRRPTLP